MASPHLPLAELAVAATDHDYHHDYHHNLNHPAAPADSRPPTSYADDAADSDDDPSGGVSLADFQHFMDAAPPAHALDEHSVTAQLQSFVAQFQLLPHVHAALPAALDVFEPALPYHVSNVHVPPHPVLMSHLSSSDPSLEPPPTLQEAHLSILDKASFMPITSFFHRIAPQRPTVPGLDLVQVPTAITRHDLHGDQYDCQGIDWTARNTTRSAVRAKRVEYENDRLCRNLKDVRKVSLPGDPSEHAADDPQWLPPTAAKDNFFQFRRNNTSHTAFFPHFQLRNVISATSRNDVFFAAGQKVLRADADSSDADVITDLSKRLATDSSITTIATLGDVLIAGAFEGEYAITDLSSAYGTPYTFGRTTDFAVDTKSRIVNHMHLFGSRRTYSPQAVLCSNDHRLRILDCVTNTFTHCFHYPAAVNCAATSPDGRMRVVVGDFQETLITNAETGQPFETLNSHTDDAFACAWADDGIHVATAAQDSTIVVWDARYWERPLTVMTSELSIPRSLRFSPIGSGPRVLVSAEADDYVSVINAQTFESKQVFDFFGPIGGVTFTPDGQSLFIANAERRFGGIIELDRTGWAEKTTKRRSWDNPAWDDVMTDWAYDSALNHHERVAAGDVSRQRRHVDLSQLVV